MNTRLFLCIIFILFFVFSSFYAFFRVLLEGKLSARGAYRGTEGGNSDTSDYYLTSNEQRAAAKFQVDFSSALHCSTEAACSYPVLTVTTANRPQSYSRIPTWEVTHRGWRSYGAPLQQTILQVFPSKVVGNTTSTRQLLMDSGAKIADNTLLYYNVSCCGLLFVCCL